jgi:hypothetical protein
MNGIVFPLLTLVLLFFAASANAGEITTNGLPDIDDVLKRVLNRAEVEGRNDREFREHYAFTRTKISEYRNSKGKLKKQEVKRSVNEPAPHVGETPEALGGDGEPDEHDRRELHQDPNGDVKGRAFEKSDFQLTEDLLKRYTCTLVGRETIRERPALVIDFKPASDDLPVRNLKDRFINKGAGRVWVDEADAALVKVDVHLTESVNVVGGLVGAVHQCSYQFDRQRTADGLWFTTRVTWHLEGRQVFVHRIIDYQETRGNIRKVW